MKKLAFYFAFLSVIIIGSVVLAEAEKPSSENDSEFYVGIFLGGVFPQQLEMTDNKDPIVELQDLDLENGLTCGAKVGCRIGGMLKKALALELEYNHITNTDVDAQHGYTTGGRKVEVGGEIPIHSIFLNFILRHPNGKLHPYIGVGTGWSWFNFKHVYQSVNTPGFTDSDEQSNASDNTSAVQGLLGLEIDVTDRASFALGYKYYHVEPKLNNPGVDLEYTAHIATDGFNFSF